MHPSHCVAPRTEGVAAAKAITALSRAFDRVACTWNGKRRPESNAPARQSGVVTTHRWTLPLSQRPQGTRDRASDWLAHRLVSGTLQELGQAPDKGGEILPDADLAGTMFNGLGNSWDRAPESIEGRNKRSAPRQRLTPSRALQKIAHDHEDPMGIFVMRVRIVAAEVREILGQLIGLTHHDLDLVVP